MDVMEEKLKTAVPRVDIDNAICAHETYFRISPLSLVWKDAKLPRSRYQIGQCKATMLLHVAEMNILLNDVDSGACGWWWRELS